MAHHNTVFAQMLKLIPRHEFESLANQHHAGRRLRKMTRWTQFVAMATAQLFFKWIKQNLKIKRFLGTSKNAVLTQIWIAMCVYLLLSYIKFLNHIQPSLQQMLRLLQLNLFERRDLLELLKGDPPEPRISPNQATLLFS